MNSKNISRLISTVLAFVVAFSMVFVSAPEVSAKATYSSSVPKVLWKGDYSTVVTVWRENKGSFSESKITSVRTSNRKAVCVNVYGDTRLLRPVNPGKANITIKYINGAGKTKTMVCKVTVKKYPKQIKSLTINDKKVDLSKKKFKVSKKFTGTKAKIKMTLKDGWKVRSVYSTRNYKGYDKEFTIKKPGKVFKKGKEISFPSEYKSMELFITFENKNDPDQLIRYYIKLHR